MSPVTGRSCDSPPAVSIRLDSSDPENRQWPVPLCQSTTVLRCDATTRRTTLSRAGEPTRDWTDPLDALRWMESQALSRRGSQWIGYLGYDLGRLFEALPGQPHDELRLPLFAFAEFEVLEGDPVARVCDSCAQPARVESPCHETTQPVSTFTRDQYVAAVRRAIEYIEAGDVFQVNLSQRFAAPLRDDPIWIYNRLLESTPARFGGYLDFGDFVLVCNSPELFLRVSPDPASGSREVITRPIKGTRANVLGAGAELLASVKDAAELNMIVDLERNDLGRVCQIGSVSVSEPRKIEAHPTVYHGVATIRGVLREDVGLVDLLRATFPGGSVTGAPKIRAMQIIDELEPVRRGPYCGAIGYLGGDGRIEFNVAIRTMIIKGDTVHVPVGGGIVADSDPAAEYAETLVKARAMLGALGISTDTLSQ